MQELLYYYIRKVLHRIHFDEAKNYTTTKVLELVCSKYLKVNPADLSRKERNRTIRSIKYVLDEDYEPDNGRQEDQDAAAVPVLQHPSDKALYNIKNADFKLEKFQWKEASEDFVEYNNSVRALSKKKRKARKCKQRDYLNVLFDTDQHFESRITTRFNREIQAYENGETD